MRLWRMLCLLVLLLVVPFSWAEHNGKVVETINGGGYTYVLLETGEGQIWLAGPETELAAGDRIVCGQGMEMVDFKSPTLNRTFRAVWFVSGFGDKTPSASQSKPHNGILSRHSGAVVIEKPAAGTLTKAGVTIEEIYRDAARLKGSEIEVRGLVVKVNVKILGQNWIHIMDGTGEQGQDDLTVTTETVVTPGEVVLVKGILETKVEIGSGYGFEVLIRKADVSVEKPR